MWKKAAIIIVTFIFLGGLWMIYDNSYKTKENIIEEVNGN